MAGQQHRGQDGGDEHRARQRGRGADIEPVPPQQCCTDADARTDRRRERHRVVGVHDAVGEAEHRRGDEQPAAPQDQRRPRSVGAGCTPRDDQAGHEADHRRGQQPRDVQPHSRAEQPAPADVVVEIAEAAGLVTRQPAEPL